MAGFETGLLILVGGLLLLLLLLLLLRTCYTAGSRYGRLEENKKWVEMHSSGVHTENLKAVSELTDRLNAFEVDEKQQDKALKVLSKQVIGVSESLEAQIEVLESVFSDIEAIKLWCKEVDEHFEEVYKAQEEAKEILDNLEWADEDEFVDNGKEPAHAAHIPTARDLNSAHRNAPETGVEMEDGYEDGEMPEDPLEDVPVGEVGEVPKRGEDEPLITDLRPTPFREHQAPSHEPDPYRLPPNLAGVSEMKRGRNIPSNNPFRRL